jgi:hypothetical protein
VPWKQVSSSETACHPRPRRNNTMHRTSRHPQSRTLRIIRDAYQTYALLYTCRRGSPALSTCDSRIVPAARNTQGNITIIHALAAKMQCAHQCLGVIPPRKVLCPRISVPTKCNKGWWVPYSLRNAFSVVFAPWFLASHVVFMHSRTLDAGSCGVLAFCKHLATFPCAVRTCASYSSFQASVAYSAHHAHHMQDCALSNIYCRKFFCGSSMEGGYAAHENHLRVFHFLTTLITSIWLVTSSPTYD